MKHEMKTNVDLDEVLVESVEFFERYLQEHQILCDYLKQGFLMLTRAKLRLQEHVLSEISYHEEFEALNVVIMDSEGNWRLQNVLEAKAQHAASKSSLPPSDLRQAQKQFLNGLQAMLVTASYAHKAQKAVHEVMVEKAAGS
ncbi:unnamed protein product [Peronospora belbahrii]|uniref:SPX domain-containing protein n=1 Tax=Peronospora belbahrii TaxID=622444 RepID=A0AAU9KNU4_9STRA|nr:unnamed protein product [Peronospora belbahrii]CAH0520732.1 unnamed protein product [Peronospora belbahrii]